MSRTQVFKIDAKGAVSIDWKVARELVSTWNPGDRLFSSASIARALLTASQQELRANIDPDLNAALKRRSTRYYGYTNCIGNDALLGRMMDEFGISLELSDKNIGQWWAKMAHMKPVHGRIVGLGIADNRFDAVRGCFLGWDAYLTSPDGDLTKYPKST